MEDLVRRLTTPEAALQRPQATRRLPLVSCIVPVFNGAAHVREAIDSILAQRHRPIEVIVVDDGSTDESQAVMAAYGEAIRVVRQANGGPAAARNAGVGLARGDLLAFLDQDDRWHDDKLTRQVMHLADHPRVDVSVAHVESVWDIDAGARGPDRQPDQPRAGAVPGYVSSTMLARRHVFERVGGFDPQYRFADSLDWFARATECGVVVDLLPDVLLYHRVHAGNLSRRGGASRAECARILKRALDRRRAAAVTTS